MNLLVSFPRSGRAWTLTICAALRDRLGKTMRHRHSHDKATTHTFGQYRADKRSFAGHRVVLTIRDPRDVTVSHWHILHYRAQRKPAADMGLFEWTQHEHGLPFVVRFLNDWGRAIQAGDVSPTVIRYEDLLAHPVSTIRRIALGFGVAPRLLTDELLTDVARSSTFNKVRQRFPHSNAGEDKRRYSTRRGEAGVWGEYYTEEERRWVNDYLREHLRHFREYHS